MGKERKKKVKKNSTTVKKKGILYVYNQDLILLVYTYLLNCQDIWNEYDAHLFTMLPRVTTNFIKFCSKNVTKFYSTSLVN